MNERFAVHDAMPKSGALNDSHGSFLDSLEVARGTDSHLKGPQNTLREHRIGEAKAQSEIGTVQQPASSVQRATRGAAQSSSENVRGWLRRCQAPQSSQSSLVD